MAAIALAAVTASSALAVIKNPDFSKRIYRNCPVHGHAEDGLPNVVCVFAATEPGAEGGSFTVGKITTPLAKQIVLQYGIAENENDEEESYVPPTHGVEAITPTPEKVPGTPIAHITPTEQEELGWPESLKVRYRQGQVSGAAKTVYETIELAGTVKTSREKLLSTEGTAVEAPVKIKGENKWLSQLGDVCYIGSEEDPIVQHLTTGTSVSPLTGEEIHGAVGELQFLFEFTAIAISHDSLVDNTYPVPGAKCTGPYSSQIAATIDREFEIPAVAGASRTELKGSLYNAINAVAEAGGAN